MASGSNFLQIRDFLNKCSLSEYYDKFIEEGFDQLQSVIFFICLFIYLLFILFVFFINLLKKKIN